MISCTVKSCHINIYLFIKYDITPCKILCPAYRKQQADAKHYTIYKKLNHSNTARL